MRRRRGIKNNAAPAAKAFDGNEHLLHLVKTVSPNCPQTFGYKKTILHTFFIQKQNAVTIHCNNESLTNDITSFCYILGFDVSVERKCYGYADRVDNDGIDYAVPKFDIYTKVSVDRVLSLFMTLRRLFEAEIIPSDILIYIKQLIT